jgi:flagellin
MEMNSVTLSVLQNYGKLGATANRISAQLSSGNRLVSASVDPSGLAISKGMQSWIRGSFVAIQNAQETLSLISLADKSLENVSQMVIRIRDIAVRMANEATSDTVSSGNPNIIIPSDQRTMYEEMASLAEEIRRTLGGMTLPNPPFIVDKSAVKFNGKDLFFAAFDSGQTAQIGAENGSVFHLAVVIPSMTDIADSIPTPATPMPGNFTAADFKDFALIQLSEMDVDLSKISDVRSALGAQHVAISHIIDEMCASGINLSGANSRLADTDISETAAALKQNLITQSTADMALIHLNDMRGLVLVYLDVLPVNAESEQAAAGEVVPASE